MKGPSSAQLLAESIYSLRSLGRRSVLALLGITVGSASIIALLNIGNAATDDAMKTVRSMGTDTLVVSFPQGDRNQHSLPLTIDPLNVKNALPALAYIAPITTHSTRISFEGKAAETTIIGTTPDFAPTLGLKLQEGRFLSEFDHRETFIVIGQRVAQNLSPTGHPVRVGDLLRIQDYLYQVIGIAESLPANPLLPVTVDDSVFIAIDGIRRLRSNPEIGNVIGKVAPTVDLDSTAETLRNYLSATLNRQEVQVQIPKYLLDSMKRQASTFAYLLIGLGGISLLAGGVGVMNVMLMNVTARRKEIGLRIALGARPRDIRNLFLMEAISLSVTGAILGTLLGLAVAYVFAQISGWEFSFTLTPLLLGLGSSLMVGLFFGLHPAISAARLQPVEALRDE